MRRFGISIQRVSVFNAGMHLVNDSIFLFFLDRSVLVYFYAVAQYSVGVRNGVKWEHAKKISICL